MNEQAQQYKKEFESQGVVSEFKWQTVNDDFVCEVCRKRNDKTFPLADLEKLYPAHEGCRCYLLPIVDMDLIATQFEAINAEDKPRKKGLFRR